MDLKKLTLYYRISFSGFLGAAVMFCIIMVFIIMTSDNKNAPDIVSDIMAALFWAFVIVGTVFVIIAGKKERQIYRQMQSENNKYSSQLLAGVFSFFKNKKSKAADIVFIFSLIITIILYFIHINIPAVIIIMTTLVLSSFILHSFWNGKIYNCINYLKDQSENKE